MLMLHIKYIRAYLRFRYEDHQMLSGLYIVHYDTGYAVHRSYGTLSQAEREFMTSEDTMCVNPHVTSDSDTVYDVECTYAVRDCIIPNEVSI